MLIIYVIIYVDISIATYFIRILFILLNVTVLLPLTDKQTSVSIEHHFFLLGGYVSEESKVGGSHMFKPNRQQSVSRSGHCRETQSMCFPNVKPFVMMPGTLPTRGTFAILLHEYGLVSLILCGERSRAEL